MAVAIEDVGDQESLDAYLRALPGDKRRAVSLRVAVRAAAQVLPIAALYFVENNYLGKVELTAATVFGALAIAAVAAVSPTAAIGYAKAAANASGATAVGTNVAATFAAANVATYGAAASANAATFATVAASLAAIAAAATLAAIATDAAKAAASANKAAYRVDLWPQVRSDLRGDDWSAIALAPEIRAMWEDAKTALSKDTHDWRIWINWYDRLIANRNWHPDAMAAELTKITDADWRKGPAHINPMFNKVLAVYEAEDASRDLLDAAPFEFSFDALAKVMRMVGIDDNMRHLRQPEIVQAFIDDADQVRDLFQDFVDDAATMSGGGNYVGLLNRKAQKVLEEFQRVKDQTHLRAEYLVIQAKELELFANQAEASRDLGPLMHGRLLERIGHLKKLCRRHFGPSYLTLAPLADLNFEQIDKDAVVALFDEAIAQIEILPTADYVGLEAEGIAILHDMRNELTIVRAGIAEASTEDFRAILEGRFAESTGSLGLTLAKFYKRSKEVGTGAATAVDIAIKTHERREGMLAIFDLLKSRMEGTS